MASQLQKQPIFPSLCLFSEVISNIFITSQQTLILGNPKDLKGRLGESPPRDP